MGDQPPRRIATEDVPRLEAREYRQLLKRTTLRRVPISKALELLGRLIDAAFDRRDLGGLKHAFDLADEFSNRRVTPQQEIMLHYFVGNIWSSMKFLTVVST